MSVAPFSVRIGIAVVVLSIPVGVAASNGSKNLSDTTIPKAAFEADGSVRRPIDYRHWVHVGTRIKFGGLSILDGKQLSAPQVFNAYVEPSAMASFRRTGRWMDGAQIIKEIATVRTGAGCDHVTSICTTDLGTGLFEDSYQGLGLMVKDVARYPGSPGHWAYFSFSREGNSYETTARQRAEEQCSACHVKLASNTDYVILRAHLALSPSNVN